MVFHFDRDELWRVWAALFLLAAAAGLALRAVGERRLVEGVETSDASPVMMARRAGPLIVLAAVLLLAAQSLTAVVLTLGIAATALLFRFLGSRWPGA
jgi:hypothetical protein